MIKIKELNKQTNGVKQIPAKNYIGFKFRRKSILTGVVYYISSDDGWNRLR